MAANKSVIVLTPNGRRQTVKVTPNTTILQVLEEVCQKHGYNVNDYDLKHYNNVLDVNAILRFTNIPNNAQLEMVSCSKPRSISNVTVCIQMENGERLTGEFVPDTTLLDILKSMCPDHQENAVIIYMHREMHGSTLEETTLKSLGLNSGRAMLRLLHRDPQQLKTQAHVSTPLLPKTTKEKEPKESVHYSAKQTGVSKTTLDPIALLKAEKEKIKIHASEEVVVKKETHRNESSKVDYLTITNNVSKEEKEKKMNYKEEKMELQSEPEQDLKIQFLGERNTLLFNQAGTQALPKEDLPDSFFDLTVQDARIIQRDAIRRREELEDAPLLTDAQREVEESKRITKQLKKYRRTVIRIQFPDQLVLQALFEPLETVQHVKDFVKNYLVDPHSDFMIYTTPPKQVLNPDAKLIDENLVPSAIVHYSGPSSLKPELLDKLTDPRAAGIQAIRSRMTIASGAVTVGEETMDVDPVPGPSGR